MSKFYILKVEHNSVWEVVGIDMNDKVVEDGWLTALCLDPGEEDKAFIGCKLQLPAMTNFDNPSKYDVSKTPFHLTALNNPHE
jgi:hypothetical protein